MNCLLPSFNSIILAEVKDWADCMLQEGRGEGDWDYC